jgi:predicted PurR-regulated permease PerM
MADLNRIAPLGLLVIFTFLVLDFAQDFFAPVLCALVLGIVLSPLSDLWARIGLRESVAAFVTVTLSLLFIVLLAILIEPYISRAILRAPVIWFELRELIETVRAVLLGLDEMAKDVAAAVDPDAAQTGTGAEPAVSVPTSTDALFYAPGVLAQFMIFIGTLYFFLLTRTQLYDAARASRFPVLRSDLYLAERQVARYFLTITAINASFGVIVAFSMQGLGLPAPIFWGFAAFVLNYVLYLGPIALATTLLVAGVVTFEGPYSFAPAALYLAMNATEGQFVTPALVGQRMQVNPLVVFLSLVFWLWLWGPIGGIVAIPVLIWCITLTGAAKPSPAESPEDSGQTAAQGVPHKAG